MRDARQGYVYILFNKRHGTLYTGVTSNLVKRIYEHKSETGKGFTGRYDINKLGYYEVHSGIVPAIEREKQLKAGSRKRKIALIKGMNPDWKDLYDSIV